MENKQRIHLAEVTESKVSVVMLNAPSSNGSVKISVVIPVYNEGSALAHLLPAVVHELNEIAGEAWEIVVVDDGSTDDTSGIAEISGVKLLRHAKRRGSGAARKTGSLCATGNLVVWIDGDGTYSPSAMSDGFKAIQSADQAIGARSNDFGYLRFLRLAVKNINNRIAGALWRTPISDLNSGLRIFRRESLFIWIEELPDGFSCTSTATLAALNHRQRVVFYPIAYRPRPGKSASKFHPVADTLKLWRALWRCWLRRQRKI